MLSAEPASLARRMGADFASYTMSAGLLEGKAMVANMMTPVWSVRNGCVMFMFIIIINLFILMISLHNKSSKNIVEIKINKLNVSRNNHRSFQPKQIAFFITEPLAAWLSIDRFWISVDVVISEIFRVWNEVKNRLLAN